MPVNYLTFSPGNVWVMVLKSGMTKNDGMMWSMNDVKLDVLGIKRPNVHFYSLHYTLDPALSEGTSTVRQE